VIKKKRKKVIVIGFGTTGKRYFQILKKKNVDILILRKSKKKIFYKNKNIAITQIDLMNISLSNIDLAIISSPVKTHWYYLKIFLKLKLDIIVEKPVINTTSQFKKLKHLIKKFNNNFYINHSDLYNQNLHKLIKNLKNRKINKIIFNYGNDKNSYNVSSDNGPTQDWLPHILAIIIFFVKEISKFKILYYSKVTKKGLVYEKSIFQIRYKKIISDVYFSNFPGNNLRTFKLYFNNGHINFDSYYNNNYILYKKRKLKYNLKPKKTFDNLINIALKNLKKKKHSDFYLFEKYFKIYQKIKSGILLKSKNNHII
jgi:predicted dehydrogenase